MIYYFAYGANMNHGHFKGICPSAQFIKRVCVDGYRLVFDRSPDATEGAAASIIKDQQGRVWGGLFFLDPADIPALDAYEEYPRLYEKKLLKVRDEAGFVYDALCYARPKSVKGIPQKEYLDVVVQGARDCGLPEEYIRSVVQD